MVRAKAAPNRSLRSATQSPSNSRQERTRQERTTLSQRESTITKKRKAQQISYMMGGQIHNATRKMFKDMKHLQNSTDNLIPRLPFSRLVREIMLQFAPDGTRIQLEALKALQEASEIYLTQLMSDANRCARHAKRVTLKVIDIKLVLDLRGCSDPGYM